jgi:hypothetical protein
LSNLRVIYAVNFKFLKHNIRDLKMAIHCENELLMRSSTWRADAQVRCLYKLYTLLSLRLTVI